MMQIMSERERVVLRFFYINRITFYDLLILIPYTQQQIAKKRISPSFYAYKLLAEILLLINSR